MLTQNLAGRMRVRTVILQGILRVAVLLSLFPFHLTHSVSQQRYDSRRVRIRVSLRTESQGNIRMQGLARLTTEAKGARSTLGGQPLPSQSNLPSTAAGSKDGIDTREGVSGDAGEEGGRNITASGGSGSVSSTIGSSSSSSSIRNSSSLGSSSSSFKLRRRASFRASAYDHRHIQTSEARLEGDPPRTMPPGLIYPTCMNPTSIVSLTVGPANALGTAWEGWGTSLHYMGRYIGGLPDKNDRTNLLKLLFDPTVGLGLTRVRYVIPASLNGWNSLPIVWWGEHDFNAYNFLPGVYNWSADYKQVRAVQEGIQVAAQSNRFLHVDAVSYSPPWFMTVSGDVAGGVGGAQNIDPVNMTAYAQFLTLLAQHLATDFGVVFDTYSIMNEPLEMWWKANRTEYGCSFTPAGAKQMYAAMQQAVQASGLTWLKLAGVDSWPANTTKLLIEAYGRKAPPFRYLAVHGYLHPLNMTMRELEVQQLGLRRAAWSVGLRVWQSEWGPFYVPGTDLETALFMGRSIAEHVNIMGASAWFHWLALHDTNTVQWGALMVNIYTGGTPQVVYTKQFYGMLHYSRLIPEGSIFLQVPRRCYHGVVVAYVPSRNQIVITAANQKQVPVRVLYKFTGFKVRQSRQQVTLTYMVTNGALNYKTVKTQKVRSLAAPINLQIPKQSISSVVISNVMRLAKVNKK